MSQEYFNGRDDSSDAGEGSSRQDPDSSTFSRPPPAYLTVGDGSTSESASALIASLNSDSGYGGSVAGDSAADGDTSLRSSLLMDQPIGAAHGDWNPAAEHERQVVASHVHQLMYNSSRTKLARSISRTVETLREFQEMNRQWPAHYPSGNGSPDSSKKKSPLRRSLSRLGRASPSRSGQILRAAAASSEEEQEEEEEAESSASAGRHSSTEPRLITPQIAQEFSILKLDLKLGSLSQSELVHSLEKGSVASLLDGKINQSIKHLLLLRDRIEDISSKVLVTGDLNAGKSTFCNALLRRKVLPEDQQPCTSVFCEVLDARENVGLEEVHAVHKDREYNRNDESSYDVYALKELEDIVTDNSKYTQCKIYVKDVRTIDESLLNNGVVDIALIDAPGLNSDSIKTTAVFARQEEIDVVVFVVSAANHFTLSARDFIQNAAQEKAYMFIVVNGFDQIRDKQRCQRMILDQINKLSPRTHKESGELVHFVSSNAIPVSSASAAGGSGYSGAGGSGAPGGDPDGNPGDDDGGNDDGGKEPESSKDKGKGKEREKIQDFENLEVSLRRFVLEKRSRSKLAPARTYLMNLLADLSTLAHVNRDVADSELNRATGELSELEPAYEDGKKKKTELGEEVQKSIDDSCEDAYNYTRSTLNNTITHISEADLGVEYPGIFSAFQYAEDLKVAMLEQISVDVTKCEDHAREKTVHGVGFIQNLGLLHVGEDKFSPLSFKANMMFRRSRRHTFARQVDTPVEVWDFFDVSGLWERQEKVAETGMAMSLITVLGGRTLGGMNWINNMLSAIKVLGPDNLRRLLLPGIATVGRFFFFFLLRQLCKHIYGKKEADYVHSNANRISSEVRRILHMPAANLQSSLAQGIEDLAKRRTDVGRVKGESEVACKYFSNLLRDSGESRNTVQQIDLDAPLPGALAATA